MNREEREGEKEEREEERATSPKGHRHDSRTS